MASIISLTFFLSNLQLTAFYTIIQQMGEKITPGVPIKAPQGGAFSEAAAFVRDAVYEKRITAEEGQALTEQAYFDTMRAQDLGYPVEHDSNQLPEREATRGKT